MAIETLASRSPDKPRFFFCCGLHGSGSTWMFNLIREICRTQGVDFVSCHRESREKLPLDDLGSRLLVVKSHTPMDDLRPFIASSGEPAVITVRDPRDAVTSFMQRFPNSAATTFDEAIQAIAISAERLVSLRQLRKIPIFRYEDGFVGSVETFDRIAEILGTRPTEDCRTAILAGLAPEAVKQTISNLEAAGTIQGEDVWDRETHWHANHVGDGKIGKFENFLSPEQQDEIVRQTREFCDTFGYDVTAEGLRKSNAPNRVSRGMASVTTVEANHAAPEGGQNAATPQRGAGMKTIGLCMIVKNEAPVIRRCLDSLRPLLDYVLIEDTGSTDGTQDVIREWLLQAGLPGIVVEEPWRDFAYNRTHALAKLREHAEIDYAFMIDADDRIEIDAGFDVAAFKANMTADFYDVEVRHGPIRHSRPHLYRNRFNFSWRGVVHEFVDVPEGPLSRATATGFHIVIIGGGARSQDTAKFQRDAALLERALETEQDAFLQSRYTFYLAQSYRDFGDKENALTRYLARADLGFWDEEIYVSLNEAAKLQADIGQPAEEVLATYRRAIDKVPVRAEAYHGATLYCRLNGRNAEGYQIAQRGLPLTEAPPPVGLFVQQWVYEYGLLDEYAISAYWSGHFRECLDASLRILGHPSCPEGYRKRVLDNARFAADKLPSTPNLGVLGRGNFLQQHALVPPRPLRSRVVGSPRVLVAILAKQKEPSLPLYLECIEALEYPKSSIVLYIRTNNNTDGTERILREWVARVGHLYANVEFDAEDVAARVEQFGVHEWNPTRFSVLGRIRNISLRRALERDCAYYFVSDVDNFIRPCTLRELVALDLPIVAPLLRSIGAGSFYSNFHAEINASGYYIPSDQYQWVLNRWVRGVIEMPVVHCTYLIRADVLIDLTYEDESKRHEYVVFSDSARKSGIPQYLDNRQVYGYITFDEGDGHHVAGGIEQARMLLNSSNGVLIHDLPNLPRPVIEISGENPEHPLAVLVRNAYDQAQAGRGKLDERLLAFRGASGRRYRLFINSLIGSLSDARYMEIGSYTGSTICATIAGNKVTALVIDNWSVFGGPVKDFMHNVATFRGPEAKVSILESDFRCVEYGHIGKFNVYLFDGPHSEQDHYDAINVALPALDERFVLLIDDWDWRQVRAGTFRALHDNGLKIDFSIDIRTTMDGTTPSIGAERSDWHNGYLLAVISGNSQTG
jgi:glycosyltransferase involved in cell wall biosynthesis